MESTPSKTAVNSKNKKISKIEKNIFYAKFCVLSVVKVLGRFVSKYLVMVCTKIERGVCNKVVKQQIVVKISKIEKKCMIFISSPTGCSVFDV